MNAMLCNLGLYLLEAILDLISNYIAVKCQIFLSLLAVQNDWSKLYQIVMPKMVIVCNWDIHIPRYAVRVNVMSVGLIRSFIQLYPIIPNSYAKNGNCM